MKIEYKTLNRWASWHLCLVLFCLIPWAEAEDLLPEGGLALELLVEADNGRLRPVPLDTLQEAPPGDLLMLSVLFRVPREPGPPPQMLTLAVPDGLDYQLGTAVGPASQVLLSFNGGLSFGSDPGAGRSGEYAGARASHVRWIFTRRLSPGARGQVRYRAVKQAIVSPKVPGEPGAEAPARKARAN